MDLREGTCDETSFGGLCRLFVMPFLTFEPAIHAETDREWPKTPGKCLQNANGLPVLVDNGNSYSRERRTVDDTAKAFYSIR